MGPKKNYQVVEVTGMVEDSGLEGKCWGLYFIIKGPGANGRPGRLGGQEEITPRAQVSPCGVQAFCDKGRGQEESRANKRVWTCPRDGDPRGGK